MAEPRIVAFGQIGSRRESQYQSQSDQQTRVASMAAKTVEDDGNAVSFWSPGRLARRATKLSPDGNDGVKSVTPFLCLIISPCMARLRASRAGRPLAVDCTSREMTLAVWRRASLPKKRHPPVQYSIFFTLTIYSSMVRW